MYLLIFFLSIRWMEREVNIAVCPFSVSKVRCYLTLAFILISHRGNVFEIKSIVRLSVMFILYPFWKIARTGIGPFISLPDWKQHKAKKVVWDISQQYKIQRKQQQWNWLDVKNESNKLLHLFGFMVICFFLIYCVSWQMCIARDIQNKQTKQIRARKFMWNAEDENSSMLLHTIGMTMDIFFY